MSVPFSSVQIPGDGADHAGVLVERGAAGVRIGQAVFTDRSKVQHLILVLQVCLDGMSAAGGGLR